MTSVTAAASSPPTRRTSGAGAPEVAADAASGGISERSDRAGTVAWYLPPASSQPSERYSGIVAGYSADSG